MLKVVINRKTFEIISEEEIEDNTNCEEQALDSFTDYILEKLNFKGVENENNKQR